MKENNKCKICNLECNRSKYCSKCYSDYRVNYKKIWYLNKYPKKDKIHNLCELGLCINCPRKKYKQNWSYLRNYVLKNNKFPKEKTTKLESIKKYRAHEKERRKTDSCFRIANNLRGRLRLALKSQRTSKKNNTLKYIGCDKKFLRTYLESKFTNGMSWDNYGLWHIDHIKPISLFNLSIEEEIYKSMHYSNLQPLWAIDNLRKNAKY